MNIHELKKEHSKLTSINDHTGAAQLIINQFGTFDDKFNMGVLASKHEKQGYMTPWDLEIRDQLVKKWWPFFKMLCNEVV
jgi:hypothetical protein